MIQSDLLKLAAITTVSLGLAAGCASDSAAPAPEAEASTPAETNTSASTEMETMENSSERAEAKNAIFTAKIKQATAKKMGAEWRDTAKMLAAAEKAEAAGDYEKATSLARMAAEQYDDGIAQKMAEEERYAANHEGSSAGSSSDDGSVKYGSATAEYTVVSGDSLWGISGKPSIYGNPYQWPLIYKANSDQIKDADLIYAGQVFSIPSATESQIEAAIMHAKTRGAWTVGEVEASDQDFLSK